MTSTNLWLVAAALGALSTCLTHVFLGGRLFAAPLLASDLRSSIKQTNYFCWHLVTAALAVMAAALGWAAFASNAWPAALVATAMAFAFTLVNLIQNLSHRLPFHRHPQGGFFLVITALALAGLGNA